MSNQVLLEAFGEKKNISQWVNDPRCSVSCTTLSRRLKKGMPAEEAISFPATPRIANLKEASTFRRNIRAYGCEKSLSSWASDYRAKASDRTIEARLRAGWNAEEAISTIADPDGRGTNTILSAFGESKSITDWSKDYRCPVSRDCLSHRIHAGWPHETAISAPKNTRIN